MLIHMTLDEKLIIGHSIIYMHQHSCVACSIQVVNVQDLIEQLVQEYFKCMQHDYANYCTSVVCFAVVGVYDFVSTYIAQGSISPCIQWCHIPARTAWCALLQVARARR